MDLYLPILILGVIAAAFGGGGAMSSQRIALVSTSWPSGASRFHIGPAAFLARATMSRAEVRAKVSRPEAAEVLVAVGMNRG